MTGFIIATAQQKGGAGKTTVAAHLAVAAAAMGKTVVALDIDPQGSLAAWGALRAERAPPLNVSVEAVAGHRVRSVAERAARSADLVIIDAPPHAETETRQALRAADLALAPLQPSPLDLWASRAVFEAARAEGARFVFLLNKTPPRARLVETIAAQARAMGADLLTTRLGARVAFADSMADGLTAIERAPRSAAASEAHALAKEIFSLF